MSGREASEGDGSDQRCEEQVATNYGGWVYHLGVNSIGHRYCHLRYLLIHGKYVEMYKRDPQSAPGLQPTQRGVVGRFLMVEDMGRRTINGVDLYVLRIYSRVDDTKKGEIACATAGQIQKWMEAFEHAKQEVFYDLARRSSHGILDSEDEFKLGHQSHVQRYAHGLRKIITIGRGPEVLIRKSWNLIKDSDFNFDKTDGDAVDRHTWKLFHTVNGIRIFEDVAYPKGEYVLLMKSVGVVDASPHAVFELVISLDKSQRYEWDMLTSDLQLVEQINGHLDVVYGTYDPKYLTRWHSKRDFVFSRQWFCDQDGTYTVIQTPIAHKECPEKAGYHRIKINPTIWEIRKTDSRRAKGTPRSVVSQMMEIHSTGWGWWRKSHYSKFHKTIPYVLLCQVAGLREYFGANPDLNFEPATVTVNRKIQKHSDVSGELKEVEGNDEFYDAIASEIPTESEDSDEEDKSSGKEGVLKLKNVSWAILSLSLKKPPGREANTDLVLSALAIEIDTNQFKGSLQFGNSGNDSNCWADPGGKGFMLRSKAYHKDCSKIPGGDPLLKLLAVDWFKSEDKVEKVAVHPSCVVKSEAGKLLPFILVINLQVPTKPNYSMVFYFGANRPIKKGSLLDKFANGDDMFRDARFKLIPSIVEGYWMVKRAVGTKACLLGRAVTCKYIREDNFLEIDVDIGSSSIARSIMGLVLGYVTSIVVDLAILIEAREEEELPEYLLGTVRINRVKLDSAVPFWGHA